MADSSSESLSEVIDADVGVLDKIEVGCGDSTSRFRGAKVMGEPWLEKFLFSFRTGVVLVPSGNETESVDELFDSDLELLGPCFFVLLAFAGPLPLPTLEPSEPNAASSVSARLCTPNVLSRCFAAASVPWGEAMECSKSSTRFMTNVMGGPWLDGAAGSSTLALRDRGLIAGGRASPPGIGRILKGPVEHRSCRV
jgi:hypothetical protein